MSWHKWLVIAALLGTSLTPLAAADGPALSSASSPDCRNLRLAIEDLLATFGPQYPRGRDYLAKLEVIEKSDARTDSAELAALRRDALLDNPLLRFDKLLMVRRQDKGGDIGMTPNWGGKTDIPKTGYDNEIVVLSPVKPDGALVTLFRPEDATFVGDLDLHWNPDRLLFSMPSKNGAGAWQVFELPLDPSTGRPSQLPRQITEDLPGVDSYDACYLPDGRIVFSSTASQNVCPCWGRSASHSAAQLYLLDRSSGRVRQLCFDQDHNWCPTVMNDGRVMYLRWEYTDTPHFFTRLLFGMNPDGTGQMALYGSNSYWPNALFDARPVPGHASRVIGVVGGHHGSARAGELVLFDARKGQTEADGVVQRIPGFGKKVEPIILDALVDASWPKFLHPYPLSDKHFLVSCKLNPAAPWTLCLADVFDNIVPIRSLPGSALLEPLPMVRRPVPPVVPDRVDLGRKDATVHVSDIYAGPGLVGVPRGTVKRLRVLAYHYAYLGTGGHGAVGTDGSWDVKRILGTVPVRDDGSASFVVPANTPLSIQPLDGQGRAVQLMRSWFTAMPGEHVSCTGCHERRAETPLAKSSTAMAADSDPITPWRGPARGFSFAREVQPVLDRYCLGCHNGQPWQGQAVCDLRGGRMIDPNYRDPALGTLHPQNDGCCRWHLWPINRSTSYEVLQRYVRRPGAEGDYHLLPPMEYHADTSELIQMLRKGHHGVQLDDEAWDRLTTWIDLNVPYHGNWSEYNPGEPGAIGRRREYASRFASLEDDPERLPPLPQAAATPRAPGAGLPTPRDPASARPAVAEIPAAGWPFGPDEARRRQQEAARSAGAKGRQTTETTLDLGKGLKLQLVLVPAGEFLMGDAVGGGDEQPLSRVRIERPFWIGKFEVTNAQYASFDPRHDSRYISVYGKDITYRGLPVNQPEQPVVRVPWTRAMDFCRWLSAKTGRTFSLPTEAQWEWACRCGSAAAMSYGEVTSDFGKWANLADKSLNLAGETNQWGGKDAFDWIPKMAAVDDGARVTTRVGRYLPNAWGLHDVHGNAAEWTRSLARPYPYRDDDGRNDAAVPGLRVVRGGSFQDRPHRARSAYRLAYAPWQPVFNVGFRVIGNPEPSISLLPDG